VGDAVVLSAEAARDLAGEEWHPKSQTPSGGLRVPSDGLLEELCRRHERFLRRIGVHGLTAPPSLTRYRMIPYRRTTDREIPPFAAFSLLTLDAMNFRPFDAARKGLTVAGMMRHAVRRAADAAGWSAERTDSVVLGHQDKETASSAFSRRDRWLPSMGR
jgi:CRISPR-associated protein Csb2